VVIVVGSGGWPMIGGTAGGSWRVMTTRTVMVLEDGPLFPSNPIAA